MSWRYIYDVALGVGRTVIYTACLKLQLNYHSFPYPSKRGG